MRIINISILLVVLLFSCSKKKASIEEIRKSFDKNPTVSNFSKLKKHYKKKDDKKSLLEIFEIYYKANPKDPYIKTDIAKIYVEQARAKKGDEKLSLLMKASKLGYYNENLVSDVSKLVDDKIKALKKENNEGKLKKFLEDSKKYPLNRKLRTDIDSLMDFLLNKKKFEEFYKPFKQEFDKKSVNFIKMIFPAKDVLYDVKNSLFLFQIVSAKQKDLNTLAKNQLTVLKYAVENNKRPPVGKEFEELYLNEELFKCEEAKKEKKLFTMICKLSLEDLARALFAARNSKEQKDKKGKK